MSSLSSLYDALQQFRAYVESNMPYKETVYFGSVNPATVATPANIGAMYFQTNNVQTSILNVFYKASTGDTDWLPFNSGGSSSNSISNTAGLDIIPDVDFPSNLKFTLLNSEGGAISLASPLNLYFQNIDLNTEKGFFQTISITSPIVFSLEPIASLGATQDTVSKLYVYVGVKASDPLERIVALKVNSRLDTTKPITVYDFRNTTQLKDRTYANLASPTASDDYRLKLVSIVDIIYSSGAGWQVPQIVTPYLPELDIISDKLLTDSAVGVPLRQQLASLNAGTATLKDLQLFYNNLSVQTYTEINNTKEISFSVDSILNTNDFKQYYAIILKPAISGLDVSIPSILEQKSLVFKNSGNFNVTLNYSSGPVETVVIEPNETVNLIFCGTSVVTSPKIINLTNKEVPNTLALRAIFNSGLAITAKHPTGSNLSLTNYVKVDFPSYITNSIYQGEMDTQTIKLISNLVINVPTSASIGLSQTANYPQPIHVYLYNSSLGQGLAVCGGRKLYRDRTYPIFAINGASQDAGQLFSSTAVSGASIKYLGYVNFNFVTKTVTGVSLDDATPTEILENIEVDALMGSYQDVLNTDTTFSAIKKSVSNDNWLRNLSYVTQDIALTKRLNVTAPVDGTVDYNLNFLVTYGSTGYPTNLGQRYCIFDYPSSKIIGIYSNPNSVTFIADVVTTDVTLKWHNNAGIVISQNLLLTAGKKYLIWVAGYNEFSSSDTTSARLRIISKYPEDVIPPQNITKNFKTPNLGTGSYTAVINDALVFDDNNIGAFSITLPNTSAVGSKVYMYFKAVPISYTYLFSIFRSSSTPFYQTIENAITVNNGGFYLEFEYTLVNNTTPYWYVTQYSYLL